MDAELQHKALEKNRKAKELALTMRDEVYPALFDLMKKFGIEIVDVVYKKQDENDDYDDYIGVKSDGTVDIGSIGKENGERYPDFTVETKDYKFCPVFEGFTFGEVPHGFQTISHFYLFYCNQVIKITNSLLKDYYKFSSLIEKGKKISIPLERTVLVEKFKAEEDEKEVESADEDNEDDEGDVDVCYEVEEISYINRNII